MVASDARRRAGAGEGFTVGDGAEVMLRARPPAAGFGLADELGAEMLREGVC